MRIITLLAGGIVAVSATVAAAQAPRQTHQHQGTPQHEATNQHAMAASGEKCCCEEMMKKMRSEMMQKHQGTGMGMQKDAPQPQPNHAH